MPELPEVETTLRGIEPHIVNQTISEIVVSQKQLRWPIPSCIHQLQDCRVNSLFRRGKYIVINTNQGSMIWHLGMSGSMRISPQDESSALHEHVKVNFKNGTALRYKDPRRFGALLYTDSDPLQHKLLKKLGVEPLQDEFNPEYLQQHCKGKTRPIKSLIMDSHIVVGVGNIYACESLFSSRINPKTKAGKISYQRLQILVETIKQILQHAILQGGTTLQDFSQSDGSPGYFAQQLNVYGNKGSCSQCGKQIKRITQNQRSTFYCPTCQR